MAGGWPSVSVLIPARSGGALLERVARTVREQRYEGEREFVVVDSGSAPEELERLRELGAKVVTIQSREFDHGSTRDRAARESRGEILVFLNQDALPVDERWLERLVAPFGADPSLAAVQGAIRELPEALLSELGRRRFFWDSCGPRFYFTRESVGWIDRHGGIGFSTVNCAIARWAWEQIPLGPAVILEDKLWQRRAHAAGLRIGEAPEAVVWHTHDYDLGGLARRCAAEGIGWRLVGERYPLARALADAAGSAVWREWRRGLRARQARRAAELLFPLVRPLALWWGNVRGSEPVAPAKR